MNIIKTKLMQRGVISSFYNRLLRLSPTSATASTCLGAA